VEVKLHAFSLNLYATACYSGGQQRRVSFAVALMHDPELLILDEPTVGVDPLLRQSIWNHLVQITKDGNKTVIITTHYIEEARQAHTVSRPLVVSHSNCTSIFRVKE
jgi:ABC-type multidrug transport system ATPase subunit